MEGEVEEINNDDAFDDDDRGSSPLPARIAVNNRKTREKTRDVGSLSITSFLLFLLLILSISH